MDLRKFARMFCAAFAVDNVLEAGRTMLFHIVASVDGIACFSASYWLFVTFFLMLGHFRKWKCRVTVLLRALDENVLVQHRHPVQKHELPIQHVIAQRTFWIGRRIVPFVDARCTKRVRTKASTTIRILSWILDEMVANGTNQ